MVIRPRETAPFPEKIGRYELLLPIGTGGMATVYLARTTGPGGFHRDVAVKLVHAHLRADEESRLHLMEEAKLAARIRHPNVVPVIEVAEDPFGLYLVMEYIEGETLSGLIRHARNLGQRLPHRIVARIMQEALAGLHAAHELTNDTGQLLQLVHRDFSPQNILVGIDGHTKLTDFGVAKAADRAVRTKTGLVKGKVSYMSPEQARGHQVDRRCDVWAAGVVAWEMLAGRRLYTQDDDVSILLSVVTEEPPLLSTVIPDVPKDIEAIIASALCPDIAERCPSALEFKRRLDIAWLADEGIADSEEVSEYVRNVVAPKLAERNLRIVELRDLRVRMGELAQSGEEEESRSPMAIPEADEPPTRLDGLSAPRASVPPPNPDRVSQPTNEARRENSSVPATRVSWTSQPSDEKNTTKSRKVWISSGLVTAALTVLAFAFGQASQAEETNPSSEILPAKEEPQPSSAVEKEIAIQEKDEQAIQAPLEAEPGAPISKPSSSTKPKSTDKSALNAAPKAPAAPKEVKVKVAEPAPPTPKSSKDDGLLRGQAPPPLSDSDPWAQ